MEAKFGWAAKFPLTEDHLWEDLRSVPHARQIHLGRAAQRWGLHPTVARVLISDMTQGYTEMFESWDPTELNGGMFPEDVSRWWG